MKRKIAIVFCAMIVALCVAVFVGCERVDEKPTPVLQFDGATVDQDNKIEITVEKDVKSVKLTDKIVLQEGYTWKLYADKMGVVEIPTKVAANPITAELLNGDNEFYIVVSSADDKETIVYELAIFRNHDVYVNYEYNGKIVKTDTVETNSAYTVSVKGDESFFDDGFVFNGWLDKDDNKVTTINIEKESVILTADLTGKTTAVTLDADGGEIASITATITYGQSSTLPVPTKEGYAFVGWYVNGNKFTTYNANYSAELTATAKWSIQSYTVYITKSDSGIYVTNTVNQYYNNATVLYGNSVTAKTKDYEGSNYTWLGWYEGDELLSTELTYQFDMPARNVILTAKWEAYVASKYIQVSNEAPTQLQEPCIVKAESTVNLLAPTDIDGLEDVTKIWLGWFVNDELISREYYYEYAMPYDSVTFVGKYKLLTFELSDKINAYVLNNAGQIVTNVKAGELVTLVAKPYLGYRFSGWYDNTEVQAYNDEWSVRIQNEDVRLGARCELINDMKNLVFTSDEKECYVTDIKDKSLADIVIPDCVTEIKAGLLADCSNLVNLTIPFVGQRAYAQLSTGYQDNYELKYYFGHLFDSYRYSATGIKVEHTLRDKSTTSYFYLPTTLKSVTVLSGNIRHGAFSNCTTLTSVTIGANVKSIGIGAFSGCSNLTSVTFESQDNWVFNKSGVNGGSYSYYENMADTALNAERLVFSNSNQVWFVKN